MQKSGSNPPGVQNQVVQKAMHKTNANAELCVPWETDTECIKNRKEAVSKLVWTRKLSKHHKDLEQKW